MPSAPAVVWVVFFVFILAMILLDLGIFHRNAQVVSLPEALGWTALWTTLAIAFAGLVYVLYGEGSLPRPQLALPEATGHEAAIQFFTGFVTEKSLSIGNIFVVAMIFAYFRVPAAEQHRLLLWGVIGAVLLRGLMIGAGFVLIARFEWIIYVFGLLLIASAGKMLVTRHDNITPERNMLVRLVRRIYPVTDEYHGNRFFVLIERRRAAPPLLLALVLIETSNIMFAIDSIPAIFAITRDPFLVWTSNVLAILGLRSLYFALAGLMDRFRYLKMSLVFLLVYVGVKMLLSVNYSIPTVVSLAMIGGILSVGVLASLVAGGRDTAALLSPLSDQLEDLFEITVRQARRTVVFLVGSTIVAIGTVMIVLPGPALLVIPLGLSVLAIEFAWARRWLSAIRKRADSLSQRFANARLPDAGKGHDGET